MNHPYSGNNAYIYANHDYTDYRKPTSFTSSPLNGWVSPRSFMPTNSFESLPQASPPPWSQKFQEDERQPLIFEGHPYSTVHSDVGHEQPADSVNTQKGWTTFSSGASSPTSPLSNSPYRTTRPLRVQHSLDSFKARPSARGIHDPSYVSSSAPGINGGIGDDPLPRGRSHSQNTGSNRKVHVVGGLHRRWHSDRPPSESYRSHPSVRRKSSKKHLMTYKRSQEFGDLDSGYATSHSMYQESSKMPDEVRWSTSAGVRSSPSTSWKKFRKRLRHFLKRLVIG